jgi:hypothetical protein
MTAWTDRMDAIRQKRMAAGLPIGRVDIRELIRDAAKDLSYAPNVGYDYGEDIARHPFQWQPGEPVRVSLSFPQTCACGEPVRSLRPSATVRPGLCGGCLEPDGSDEIDLADLIRRCKPRTERKFVNGRWLTVDMWTGEVCPETTDDGNPVRSAALYLPGLAGALDATAPAGRRARGRAYTIEQKREAVRLYRDGMTAPEVAEKLGVTLPSVKNWVRRYADDPFFVS